MGLTAHMGLSASRELTYDAILKGLIGTVRSMLQGLYLDDVAKGVSCFCFT